MTSSRHLVDPELLPILEAMPAYHDLGPQTLDALRAAVNAAVRLQIETTDTVGVSLSEAQAPHHLADAPAVRVRLYRPSEASTLLPALIHIHGGGGVMGCPEMRHANLVAIARDLRCLVASVDYRLAPETPHPGPLEDSYAALAWLRRSAGTLGVDPARIAVGGESAGGGLAAALALLARDRGDPPLVAQMLSYPMLDDRTATSRPAPPLAGEFVWGAAANAYAWRVRLGLPPGTDGTPAYAAPARTQALEGLPPAFIGVGALDLFLEENLDYAARLARAGVPTELHVYPGAFHAFDGAAAAAVSQAFKADWRRSLGRAFSR